MAFAIHEPVNYPVTYAPLATRARAPTVPTALEGHLRLQGGCGGGCRACDSIWRYVSLRLGPIGAGAPVNLAKPPNKVWGE